MLDWHLMMCPKRSIYFLRIIIYNMLMIIGASILLAGIAIGYIVGVALASKAQTVKDFVNKTKNIFIDKKGVIVDLTPPVELGELPNEEK